MGPWNLKGAINMLIMLLRKAVQLKQAQIKGRSIVTKQRAGNLADYGGEFEPMAGTRTGDQHLGMGGMIIEDKMLIRRVGVPSAAGKKRRSNSRMSSISP